MGDVHRSPNISDEMKTKRLSLAITGVRFRNKRNNPPERIQATKPTKNTTVVSGVS